MKFGTRIWALITIVVGGGVVAAGWFLGASPALAAQAQAEQMRQDAISQNDAISASIAVLKKQEADIATYESRNSELEAAIPSDVEQAAFIRSLNDLAGSSGVTISQITMGDPLPYVAPVGEVLDPDRAPNPLTDSRVTSDNFLLVPVSLAVTGDWGQVLAFTHGVQMGTRLMLVTSVDTSTAEGSSAFTTQLSGAMYVLVRPPAPAATDTPADATDEAAPTEG